MVKLIRLYTGLGFTVTFNDDIVIFTASISGNWYFNEILVERNSPTYLAEKVIFPGMVSFEAKLGNEYKKHSKWIEF